MDEEADQAVLFVNQGEDYGALNCGKACQVLYSFMKDNYFVEIRNYVFNETNR